MVNIDMFHIEILDSHFYFRLDNKNFQSLRHFLHNEVAPSPNGYIFYNSMCRILWVETQKQLLLPTSAHPLGWLPFIGLGNSKSSMVCVLFYLLFFKFFFFAALQVKH